MFPDFVNNFWVCSSIHIYNPGIRSGSPALQIDALPSEPLGKLHMCVCVCVCIYILTYNIYISTGRCINKATR